MADYEIECNECGWRGMESALDNHADESGGEDVFSFCPDCGGTDFENVAEQE
jgi:predicted  nucleic acid-binding Zn-ribbon protein